MATKKREIYARAAVQLRTHERCIRAEKLCPGAMGLYLFLLIHSRGEASHGDVAEVVAEASWGAPEKYRRKQADALVAVGLAERIEDRLHVVKYDEHNDTPDDIATARESARNRKQSQRSHAHVTRDIECGHAEVPISISISDLGSGSPEGMQGEATTDRSEPPEWFHGSIATAEATGEKLRPLDAWLRYRGHRVGKNIAPCHEDAVYWLTTVMVPEARRERQAAADKRERDEKFDRQRAAKSGPVEPGKLTAAEQAELAARVPMPLRRKVVA